MTAKSDHCPILLETDLADTSVRANQKRFRYECMWERDTRFGDILSEAWNATGRANTVTELSGKLASVANELQSWGRTTFGAVRAELRRLRKQLEELRSLPNRMEPSREEEIVEARMVELCLREEIMWRQRARIQWLTEGDSNTNFFSLKSFYAEEKEPHLSASAGEWYCM